MDHELKMRIAASREQVWQALYGDLAASGPQVEVVEARAPATLEIVTRTAPGEQMRLRYQLEPEGEATIVDATIAVAGPLYAAKKLLSFGSIDRAYLRLLAVGLDNLSGHFGGAAAEPE